MNSQQAKVLLGQMDWLEGRVIPVVEGPYRYRVVVHCSSRGRQKAMFANGERSYFSYIELLDVKGQWIQKGSGMVPVLPDGRLIMVVEQRPAQSRYSDRPTMAKIAGEDVDLGKFGPYSSQEFPGGAVDPEEGLKAGFLRELTEETGIGNQTATCYQRCPPMYQTGSDIALQQFCGVVFLSGLGYQSHVPTDGGLTVFALTEDEVQENIWRGVIHSAQAALTQWAFYKEVTQVLKDSGLEKRLKDLGYLTVETVKISRSN